MVHQSNEYHQSYFLALVSDMKQADVDGTNCERRMAPWFDYLRRHASESSGKTATLSLGNILEASRGGFRDTKSLLFDALFFAWVNQMSLAVHDDCFLDKVGWKLTTTQFARAVEVLGVEKLLLVKLGDVPQYIARHLKAELEGIRSELQLHKSSRIKELKGKVSQDRFPHGSSVDKCMSTEVTLCKRAMRMWLQLNMMTLAVSDSVTIKNNTRRALTECKECGRMTGALLLSSDRFQTARISFRNFDQKDSRRQELISILNQITDDDSHVANPRRNNDHTIIVDSLWDHFYVDPEGFLIHLLSIARKHSSQASMILSGISHLPGLSAYRLQPERPVSILTALSRMFRKSISESSNVSRLMSSHKADGLHRIALWLIQKPRASLITASSDIFGYALGTPFRAGMDPREALLTNILPALLSNSASSWCALKMLYSMLYACDVIKDGDAKLSSRGIKLLQATFPGGILLALASCLESSNTGDRLDSSYHLSLTRSFHERSLDLPARLLRDCVEELAHRHSQLSTPVLHSLTECDDIAQAKASWHVRLLLEPILQKVRGNSSSSTKRENLGSCELSSEGSLEAARQHSGVLKLAKSLADLIKLNQLRVFETLNFGEMLTGTEPRAPKQDRQKMEIISRKIEILRSTKTVGEFRCALLMACAAKIPYLTAEEMDSLFHGFLTELVVHISIWKVKARENSEQIVIDLLSRVLRFKANEMNREVRPVDYLEMENLSRHLATKAVDTYTKLISNERSKGSSTAVKKLRILRSLQTALREVVLIESEKEYTAKPISILLNACLRLMGELMLEGLANELMEMFRDFPEHECKQRIMCICSVQI
mmetsp:Transcript_7760/g.34209  ORF Transcript_7760/g.34209 Transcript_7760/m.34209 type:complete len:834 (-) Transcript_7760:2201-4702(-)